MNINFGKFKGRLPYASELFGIYQPLLGWKSKLTVDRMSRGEDTVFRSLTERALARVAANVVVTLSADGQPQVENLEVPDVVSTHSVPRVAREVSCIIAYAIAKKLPVDHKPSDTEWKTLLDRDAVLTVALKEAPTIIGDYLKNSRDVIDADVLAYLDDFMAKHRPSEQPVFDTIKLILDREVSVSGYLSWLAQNKPGILSALFYRDVTNPFQDLTLYQDPLSTFGHNDLQAVLSPIGLVHLFRQYFFEFDSFLGPPVGHIWLAPGTTLELVEQTARRTRTERTVELSTDSTVKSETSDTVHEELATAVREENQNNIKFGFGASVDYHNGTVDAGAHTDLSLDNARTSARETTHKQMREQTQRLSSEIRKSFKTTFKTTTEATESTGRRYVLQNSTDALINYELRRKMRQVGVQVQDIGTQLCWQGFIDDPGKVLGLAQLLHIAPPPDLDGIHAPDAPARLESKSVDLSLQFPYERDPSSEGDGETDVLYIEGVDQEYIGGIHNIGYNDKIFFHRQYTLVPPVPGYRLGEQFTMRTDHPGPVSAEIKKVNDTTIEVILHQVNFVNQPFVQMQVTALWNPDPVQQKALDDAYAKQLADYDAQRSAAEREALLNAARERIKLASQIRKRRFEDLREEERIAVYRQLIGQLMAVGESQHQDEHVTSELVRAIFDVDKMLYFVAPEWWRAPPRSRRSTQRRYRSQHARHRAGSGWLGQPQGDGADRQLPDHRRVRTGAARQLTRLATPARRRRSPQRVLELAVGQGRHPYPARPGRGSAQLAHARACRRLRWARQRL